MILRTQDFLKVEFTFKYGICELLRVIKFLAKIQILSEILIRNTCMFNEEAFLFLRCSNELYQNYRFLVPMNKVQEELLYWRWLWR